MAAAALRNRSLCAAKLQDSMRQLRRYLDGDNQIERVLIQKSDKVDVDREELISKHHEYADKANLDISSAELQEFLNPKIDGAVDLVDEATVKLEELGLVAKAKEEEATKQSTEEKAKLEVAAAKHHSDSIRRVVTALIEDIDLAVRTGTPAVETAAPSKKDMIKVSTHLTELDKKEDELTTSWNNIVARLSDEAEIQQINEAGSATLTRISLCRRNAQAFINPLTSAPTLSVSSTARSSSTSSSHSSSNMKLQRVSPPKFSNSIRDFARFKSDFKKIVEKEYDDPVYQVYVMKQNCLQGEALNLVKNLNDLDDIWDRLEKYGGTAEIVESVIKDLSDINVQKFNNQDQGVIKLIEALERGVQDLTAIDKRSDIANVYTVKLIQDKLPRRVMLKWLEEWDEMEETEDKFEKLFEYLKKERKRTEKLVQQAKEREKDKPTRDNRRKRNDNDEDKNDKSTVGHVGAVVKSSKCLIHPSSSHFTRKCKSFLKKTIEERGQLVKDLSACKLCLSLAHPDEPCPHEANWQPCGVDSCTEMHSRLVHGSIAVSMHILAMTFTDPHQHKRTLLLMQMIHSGGKETFVFWDNGSSISLVSRRYARKHNLKGVKVQYDLLTVGKVVKTQRTIMYDINIADRDGVVHTITAYEMETICEETAFFDPRITELFDDVEAKEVMRPRRNVDILIGMDHIGLHPKQTQCKENLAVFSSSFGTGKILGGTHPLVKGNDKVNAFTKLVAYGSPRNFRVDAAEKRCIDFFEAESLGVSIPPRCNRCKQLVENCKACTFEGKLSIIDQGQLGVIRGNLTLDPKEKKWTTPYPYLKDPEILKDNRKQVLSMMIKTENRLERAGKVATESYCNQWDDSVRRGVIRELSEEEISNWEGPVNYISHHEVFKEDSTSTPLRIVSNSSLKFNGISFNDILMKGPNTLTDLYAIQLRFRVHQIALVGDISKMYHSVLTTEKELHLRRLLWRNMKTDEEPKTYGTQVVAFGDRPAAAITTVAIQETADLYSHIDQEASKKIKDDMYVDDLATGASTNKEVERLQRNMTIIMAKGGFNFKGFVKSGDSSDDILALLGCGEIGRVLGIYWDPKLDQFCVKVRVNISKKFKGVRKSPDLSKEEIPALIVQKLTRAILLSITNSIYDLYGFFVPITIQLKIIIRETHKKSLKLRWNDDLPRDLKEKAVNVLLLAKEAEQIRFQRCISRKDSVGAPILIVFNDGSTVAMCTSAYIRWELKSGEYVSQLVAAKARVTPLERYTAPRSEMQSGVFGVRLAKTITESCNLKFEETVHISDSKCTIATINNDTSELKEFFGNRALEIIKHSEPKQWHHVKSEENIADLGTRANASIEDIAADSPWQLGPDWLKLQRDQWPLTQDISAEHVPEEEIIKVKLCAAVIKVDPLIDISQWRMRTYTLLMQSTARAINAIEKKSFTHSTVTPSTLDRAEKYWIQQSMSYTSEALKKGHLKSLLPKVDENGFIVLSSRALEGLKKNYNCDTFPILMKNDPFAFLWMKHVHDEDHTGRTKTVAKSRRKFWIVRAGRLFEKVKSSCYECRRLDKELAMQQMSPLPESRLAPSPAFHITSIDLTGPHLIKDSVKKKVTMKVWGLVCTCAATRAIHIDLTESYSTDSILKTLRKFVLNRGCPAEFISDQGSQMKAAAKDITKDWDWSVVSNWANSNKVKWTVVPAEGQHQNGLTESLIKSVKRSLHHVVGENTLTFSELQLAFFEIANILNSRPLGIVPGSDSDDPTPITPNDLLLGRSSNDVPQGPFNHNVSKAKRFIYVQNVVDEWWNKWYNLVLPSLVPSYKWQQRHRNVQLGDICLIRYKKSIRATFRLGRVCEVKTSNDGLVRSVRLQYKLQGEKVYRFVDRAIHGIAVIVPREEQ